MTGYMAPGKSMPLEMGHSDEERRAAWKVWTSAYGRCVEAMCKAFEEIVR